MPARRKTEITAHKSDVACGGDQTLATERVDPPCDQGVSEGRITISAVDPSMIISSNRTSHFRFLSLVLASGISDHQSVLLAQLHSESPRQISVLPLIHSRPARLPCPAPPAICGLRPSMRPRKWPWLGRAMRTNCCLPGVGCRDPEIFQVLDVLREGVPRRCCIRRWLELGGQGDTFLHARVIPLDQV
jgi:hypothetical protein